MTSAYADLSESQQTTANCGQDLEHGGKTRLPGLVLLFLIGLGLGGILCGFYTFYMLWAFSQVHEAERLAWAGGHALGFGLCAWAGWGIHTRAENAPQRCRILLIAGIIVALALFARAIITFVGDDALRGSGELSSRLKMLATMHILPCTALTCEAWRRYFLVSSNVRLAFNLYRAEEDARQAPPAVIGLFATVCGLCLVSSVTAAFGISCIWVDVGAGLKQIFGMYGITFTIIQSFIARVISQFILPLVALHALRTRRLPVVFRCLGVYLGLAIFNWMSSLAYITYLTANMDFGDRDLYLELLPSLFSVNLLLPLILWWYLSVSSKTRAWFGAKSPAPADKAAQF